MSFVRLVLASASPRRAELLAAAGFAFDVDPVNVDERRHVDEAPLLYADRVARLKAATGALRHPHRVVVGADTIVVVGHDVLGKPRDSAEARVMLRRLSGQPHEVLTGVAVAANGEIQSHVERTTVWFNEMSETDIRWYIETGEPLGKAGGYAIQGLASRFIPHIDGSYSNVVGLPIAALNEILEGIGRPTRLPRPASS
jgi:septum formation protein